MNFWEMKEWIELKTSDLKTEKLLSRVEYLRLVGAKNFSDEKYKKYLETFMQTNNNQSKDE